MTSSASSTNRNNSGWSRGQTGNPMGRPIKPETVRRRLMQDLSARIVNGDKAALEAFLSLEKAAAAND